jgi:hypothetical protein
VDSTAGGDVAVLTEVEPDPAPLPEGTSEEPAEAPKGSGRRGRWRNRRR